MFKRRPPTTVLSTQQTRVSWKHCFLTRPMALTSVLLAIGWLVGIVRNDSLSAAERPNIVWLISEDNSIHYLRMFDAHGAPTPHIAELAQHGLQFNQAFSNSPVCSVARTTLMTGCYGPRIGTQYHRRAISVPMPNGLKMFPAYLREAGYYTSNNQKKDYNADESPGTWDASSGMADWRARASGQPFFHMQSFATTHESSLHFAEEVFKSQATQTDPSAVFVAPYHPDTELFRYTVAKYHDNIRKMDQQIGEVVGQLTADGLLEDTFIFYFGDHGGVLPRGKGYAYESGLHVPLVVRIPENFKHLAPATYGSQIDGFVQFVDFGPTVLNLAGVPVPSPVDGLPLLGTGVTAAGLALRDTAFGYADRFDEKYDLVRTLRKGRYEYVRSYQPFNFDGLRNNYRYIMLAYREWLQMFQADQLNEVQSQFFRPRPVELLFDIEADPHEVNNLADDPEHQWTLRSLRQELQRRVKHLPDLSFYPESYLAEHAFSNPVEFGQTHRSQIARLVDIADLSLLPFDEAEPQIAAALASPDANERYWGLIACSCFGKTARPFSETARRLSVADPNLLVRVRAAEYLGLFAAVDPAPVLLDCLAQTKSGIEANLMLNSLVLLRDSSLGYKLDVTADSISPAGRKSAEALRRLEYLNPNAVGTEVRPQPIKRKKQAK
jgi:arylsulfatase A-like enzyme